MDLEEEFQKLVYGMYKQIDAKEADGDLTRHEAQDLRDMVYDRVSKVEGKEDDSWCSSTSNYNQG